MRNVRSKSMQVDNPIMPWLDEIKKRNGLEEVRQEKGEKCRETKRERVEREAWRQREGDRHRNRIRSIERRARML